jgi:hypothetical protein
MLFEDNVLKAYVGCHLSECRNVPSSSSHNRHNLKDSRLTLLRAALHSCENRAMVYFNPQVSINNHEPKNSALFLLYVFEI